MLFDGMEELVRLTREERRKLKYPAADTAHHASEALVRCSCSRMTDFVQIGSRVTRSPPPSSLPIMTLFQFVHEFFPSQDHHTFQTSTCSASNRPWALLYAMTHCQ
jgi:hypothetical protein